MECACIGLLLEHRPSLRPQQVCSTERTWLPSISVARASYLTSVFLLSSCCPPELLQGEYALCAFAMCVPIEGSNPPVAECGCYSFNGVNMGGSTAILKANVSAVAAAPRACCCELSTGAGATLLPGSVRCPRTPHFWSCRCARPFSTWAPSLGNWEMWCRRRPISIHLWLQL